MIQSSNIIQPNPRQVTPDQIERRSRSDKSMAAPQPQDEVAFSPALQKARQQVQPEQATRGSRMASKPVADPYNGIPVRQVQQVAKDLGYVDLSPKAIKQAYIMGESLLADYRA
ncbi:MAG: hypothetical protein KTR14_00140 [Vampirovibrio sp.]|nr:hypothetical protein [Vampirovibrio sp.]